MNEKIEMKKKKQKKKGNLLAPKLVAKQISKKKRFWHSVGTKKRVAMTYKEK